MSCFTDIENKPDDWLVLDPLTVQKPIPKTGCDTNLIVLNYLSEFKTEAQKLKVKDNLGLYVDNILSKNSTNPIANKTVYEAFSKFAGSNNTTKITWDANSNMNDFKTPGVYDIYGERTNSGDNMPISNAASGHSIRGRLFVLDSTLQPANTERCVTQILMLSNRKGHEGKMYIRTYNENNAVADGWSGWAEFSTVHTLGNGGLVDVATLDSTTTWGEYNGVLFDMNWVHGGSMGQMNNLMASINNALTALSGNEISKYFNELYFTTSSDEYGAIKSNLFGAMFKLKVYDNDPVRNGLGSIIGNADLANTMKGYLKRRIVQELDVVPFTFLSMDIAKTFGQLPRVIRRYGDVNTDGTITWSKFYELDGSESIYQYIPSQFWKS